jgi:hypothetical protein
VTNKKNGLRRKVLLKLLAYPWALLPTMAGVSALALSWSAGSSSWVTFAGGVAVLAGIGVYATRLIFGVDEATREAVEEVQNVLVGRVEVGHHAHVIERAVAERIGVEQRRAG